MAKSKLKTPDWILKGEERPKEKKGEKTFKIKRCPKCNSEDVGVILSNSDAEEGGGRLEPEIPTGSSESQTKEWECRKCGWKGRDIKEEGLNEEEFMKYSENKEIK